MYGVSEALNMLKEHLNCIQRACIYFLHYRPNITTFCALTVTTPGTQTALIPSSSTSNWPTISQHSTASITSQSSSLNMAPTPFQGFIRSLFYKTKWRIQNWQGMQVKPFLFSGKLNFKSSHFVNIIQYLFKYRQFVAQTTFDTYLMSAFKYCVLHLLRKNCWIRH